MCGIAGVRHFDGRQASVSAVAKMAADLHHRGPDEAGTWVDGPVSLGHARLAIIDLADSHQPMSDANGQFHVVFNGEILNYRELRAGLSYPFRTHGDTEVLLALYEKFGPFGIRKLRGQFALAIHDTRTSETHLFRDRLGILPLCYYKDKKVFAFASEIKALLPLLPSRAVDEDSLHDYLGHRFVPSPHTFIRGVYKVPPGHHVVVRADGSIRSGPYWELPNDPLELKVTDKEAVRLVDEGLTNAVREALIADVPVGLYLSGGVDSSLLTALAARQHGSDALHTFSATFGQSPRDESFWARKVSGIVGTTHHEISVTAEDFQRDWPTLSWYRDGPLSEPADVALYGLAKSARQHVKVVLSGEGADELFAGYPKHRFAAASRWVGAGPATALLRRLERSLPASKSRLRVAIRVFAEPTYADRQRAWFASFSVAERRNLLRLGSLRSSLDPYRNGSGDSLRRMLYADMFGWLPDNLLERGDRMAMAASVETRPPFLDHRLVELAFDLPSRYKVRYGTTKWILKQVALSHLPADVVNRPKIGFKVPLDDWFRGSLREFAFDHLTGPSSYVGSILPAGEVSKLLKDHSSGRRNEELRIWTLLSLEIWHRKMASLRWL